MIMMMIVMMTMTKRNGIGKMFGGGTLYSAIPYVSLRSRLALVLIIIQNMHITILLFIHVT